MTAPAAAIEKSFLSSLQAARLDAQPYRHWLLEDALPAEAGEAIAVLPWEAPNRAETYGKRETNNASRSYFSAEHRAQYPVCEQVAQAFQSNAVTGALEQTCGIDLSGTNLRIEYCQDKDGFWLESHTDIGVKKFTMLIYLSSEPGSEEWGTDIMDEAGAVLGRAPYAFNKGLIFIPGTDTWHGFAKRPINGVRKSIIVNYVGPEWRARHELCFPDAPIV
ncbi:2OG-Fe(II) oxygenase [Azospirillum sp. TSO22-1]|uniref:2OG-Fe(II) oxygenase n=1 Tax=Azospirillum sp. TSO22-1 TaxID=716789 RepID=UPI000D6075CD|nr:2OG-Fe(II) oxygenase [Azospirillum sp. TSO22-1]PWC54520.1 hypothetical protein TSO221_07650 [Azospirillum sp. TSO22-1]